MKAKQRPVAPEKSEAPNPRKRFRIDKLEERIAPKKGGGGTNNCAYSVHCGSRAE
jgi:hypothetical protein